jgi:hypothetical protein
MAVLLGEVFKISGVPTLTFVPPVEYGRLIANLRSPGRGLVVEGPSGIGKTTAVERAIEDEGLANRVVKLSARRNEDVEYIQLLPEVQDPGIVIIDDFHKLDPTVQAQIADYMKFVADRELASAKVIVIGINNAGQSLINFASDLANRLDILQFEQNPDEKIAELIEKGCAALNIEMSTKPEVIKAANGSFYLAQMLCFETCIASDIGQRCKEKRTLDISFEKVRADVWDRLSRVFREPCERFCRGNRFRRGGRAPYLHILRTLAESGGWMLRIREYERKNPNLRNSLNEVITKGHLSKLILEDADLPKRIHYDPQSQCLTVEDPQFVFFIQNLPWRTFAQDLGFTNVEIERRYDFALSFAGTDRDVAAALHKELTDRQFEVFYDKNEQSRMLAMDLETYLRPIYQSEAKLVVCLLGPDYPNRIWTRFEQQQFRDRIADGEVVPVLIGDARLDAFSELAKVSYETFSRRADFDLEIDRLAELLEAKVSMSADSDQ